MKLTKIIAILLLSLSSAYATSDRIGKISRAEITFEDGGTVVLAKDHSTILSLELHTEHGIEIIPTEDLKDIQFPQIDSIFITWSIFTKENSSKPLYKTIHISFGKEKFFGEYPEAQFVFCEEKYHHRGTRKKISETEWMTPYRGPEK